MGIFAEIVKYIRQSERLIVVSAVLFVSGAVAYMGERAGVIDFAGLPSWTRPTCTLVWIVAGVHVLVRLAIALASGVRIGAGFVAGLPRQRRQLAADRHIIRRLLRTRGLAREALCYARYREDNHIWTDGDVSLVGSII